MPSTGRRGECSPRSRLSPRRRLRRPGEGPGMRAVCNLAPETAPLGRTTRSRGEPVRGPPRQCSPFGLSLEAGDGTTMCKEGEHSPRRRVRGSPLPQPTVFGGKVSLGARPNMRGHAPPCPCAAADQTRVGANLCAGRRASVRPPIRSQSLDTRLPCRYPVHTANS